MLNIERLKTCAEKINTRPDLLKIHTSGLMWQTICELLEAYLNTGNKAELERFLQQKEVENEMDD